MTFSIRPKARPSAPDGRVACSESVGFGSRPLRANAGSPAASRPGRGACGGRAGIALVITMIMLAVITTLAIAFLAITHRETGAVDQMARTTDSELVCGSGMERAKAEIAAVFRMRNYFTNGLEIMGPDLIVSVATDTNRLSPGVTAGGKGLFYDPSPPVFVDTNRANKSGSAEDRFFLDLNRNGVFEHTGYVPVTTDALGPKPGTFAYLLNAGIIVTNYMVGDPQWIGELHDPTIPHGPNNRFIGRYAFLIQPIGRSLDVNWIHNDAKVDTEPTLGYCYFRNQGVGSFELNLAAFLCDLNANFWNTNGPHNAVAYYYPYDYVGNPNLKSQGTAFDDAWQVLHYRYDGLKRGLASMNDLFERDVQPVVDSDYIDTYVDGLGTKDNDVARQPWPGADSRKHFFTLHDFLTKLPTPPLPAIKGFADRLAEASAFGNSYDRYTYYRLLSQLGTDSAPEEEGKIDLNYINIHSWVDPDPVAALRATDLISWTNVNLDPVTVMRDGKPKTFKMGRPGPELFFLSVVTNLFARQPELAYLVTNALPGEALRIPILYNGSTVVSNLLVKEPLYSGRIHQILQQAANIYDAVRPLAPGETYPFLPTVFRPQFETRGNTYVAIVNYVLVRPEIEKASDFMFARRWRDLNLGELPAPDDCVYGIPLIIGARKGFPNFNEFASITSALAVRRLHVTKPLGESNLVNAQFRQELTLQITNEFQLEAWNSYYSNANIRPLQLYYSNQVSVRITNSTQQFPLIFTATNFFPSFAVGAWKSNTYLVTPNPRPRVLYWTNWVDHDKGGNTNQWGISITNHVLMFMADNDRLVDAVGLSIPNEPIDLGAEMASFDMPGATADPVAKLWARDSMASKLDKKLVGVRNWSRQLENHLNISLTDSSTVSTDDDWRNYSTDTQTRTAAIAAFNRFVRDPTKTDQDSGFAAVRRMVQTNWYRVADPLVHFTLEDLHSSQPSKVVTVPKVFPKLALGQHNSESQTWNSGDTDTPNSNPGTGTVDPTLRDPGVRTSDDWDFPLGPVPNVGWLGRVHRGTPWQTVYFKSVGKTNSDAVWRAHSGPMRSTNSARMMRPTNDWALLDVFTVSVHPNATRGRLSINQTNAAAWSAVFGGIIASAATNDAGINRVVPQSEVIMPAAVSDPLARIVEGINVARGRCPNGQFHHLGEFLQVPELTFQSPFLNRPGYVPEAPNGTEAMFDSDYERIPEQMLSLVKVGEPRFVIYSWGQSLKPARNGAVPNGDNIDLTGPSILTADDAKRGDRGTCINYQITGEMATRAVVRVEFDPNPNYDPKTNAWGALFSRPHVIVESFNILPND